MNEEKDETRTMTIYDTGYVSFCRTKDPFGELSNMAGGFPLVVAGASVRTTEALYQALKFSSSPDIQRLILDQPSPMTAKMVSRKYEQEPGFDRDAAMWYCIVQKMLQHGSTLQPVIDATNGRPIVEFSKRDDYWGAKPTIVDGRSVLQGWNRLGRMWEDVRDGKPLTCNPLGLKLLGNDV